MGIEFNDTCDMVLENSVRTCQSEVCVCNDACYPIHSFPYVCIHSFSTYGGMQTFAQACLRG